MHIWIDVLTPKQVLFFTPLIQELRQRGHEVLCTSRRYREVELLSAQRGLELRFVGRHGGVSLQEKLKASGERVLGLSDMVSGLRLDYAVSFSSPECARVAFGLGVKHLCISDSPHSEKVCRLTVPLSELLLTPWIIPYSAWSTYGIGRNRVIRYRALDPAAWLKRRGVKPAGKEELGLDSSKKIITVRLEESQASYLLSVDRSYWRRLLDSLLENFEDCEVFVLGRYLAQIEIVREAYSSKVKTTDDVVDGVALISASDIFLGMGGTMTTEAALLGIPAVSLFQGGDLYTEDYLIKKGLLVKPRGIGQTIEAVRDLLQNQDKRRHLQKKAKSVLNSMEDPVKAIAETLEKQNRHSNRK